MAELNDKIKQISELLKRDDLPEGLLDIISSISEQKNQSSMPTPTNNAETLLPESEASAVEPETHLKLRNIINKVRGQSKDPRVSLLRSVKQFVGSSRQDSIDKCIKFLSFIELSQLIDKD
jgi:hypothetical protein